MATRTKASVVKTCQPKLATVTTANTVVKVTFNGLVNLSLLQLAANKLSALTTKAKTTPLTIVKGSALANQSNVP